MNEVPYVAYESTLAREERHSKRLVNIIVTILVLWFLTIAGFIWYITLPVEEVETTQSVEDVSDSSIRQIVGDCTDDSEAE